MRLRPSDELKLYRAVDEARRLVNHGDTLADAVRLASYRFSQDRDTVATLVVAAVQGCERTRVELAKAAEYRKREVAA